MRSFELNKLVRDRIVDDMKAVGQTVTYRVVEGEELQTALAKKGVEEATEFDPKSPKALDELADQLEVLRASAQALGYDFDVIEAHRKELYAKSGGFEEGIFIERLDLADDDPWAKYYAAEPDRFKEIEQ